MTQTHDLRNPDAKSIDAITELVRLRADMVRIAHEVEGLADERSISGVRRMAPVIGNMLRDAAMRRSAVEASKR